MILSEIDWRAWSDRENRKAKWRGRLAVLLKKGECSHCYRQTYCGRLEINDWVLVDVLYGRGCPDYDGVWTRVFEDGNIHKN